MDIAGMPSHELLKQVKKLIPPLLERFHKGQLGRVAVVGGCEDYTGAPFFSANASALLGADMSHVICEPGAATVIKSYSPNIMVHPYLRHWDGTGDVVTQADKFVTRVLDMMERLHAVVIGPGLGRDPLMQEAARRVVLEGKRRELPIVLDADGLFLIQNNPNLIDGYKSAVLTPNVMEFARLCKAKGIDLAEGDPSKSCERLAKAFNGVTIIQKGPTDHISNGTRTLSCNITGGLKRSGGQGDTLTGTLATFLAWRGAYKDGLWEHDRSLSDEDTLALSAFGASAITRTCSRLAFEKKGRALQASDLSLEIPTAFKQLFGEQEDGSKL